MFNVNEKRPLHEKRSQSSKDIQRKGKKKKKKRRRRKNKGNYTLPICGLKNGTLPTCGPIC